MPAKNILKLYQNLRKQYGSHRGQWRLWCKQRKSILEREEVIIGAILTQQTNWKNVENAIENLKKAGYGSLQKIYKLGSRHPEKLKNLIRPSGFYNTKAKYLINIAGFFVKNGGVPKFLKSKITIHDLRYMLHEIHGVGYETADSILLYALDKPIFIIDEYTKRFSRRKKVSRKFGYEFLRNKFELSLPNSLRLYQDFHALIIIDGKSKL